MNEGLVRGTETSPVDLDQDLIGIWHLYLDILAGSLRITSAADFHSCSLLLGDINGRHGDRRSGYLVKSLMLSGEEKLGWTGPGGGERGQGDTYSSPGLWLDLPCQPDLARRDTGTEVTLHRIKG